MSSSATRTGASAARTSRRRAVAVAAALGTTTLVAAPAQAYTVRAGDTVSHIAVRTGASVQEIVRANGLDSRATIRVGQHLTIPGESTAAPGPSTSPSGTTYTVRPGDTVSHIAARTGTTVTAIVRANSLDGRAFIRAGQRLTIPGAASTGGSDRTPAPSRSTPSSPTYTVRAGDTVSHIAARTGTSTAEVLRLNGLTAGSVIHPGQVIRLPGSTAAPAPAPAPAPAASAYTVRSGDTLSHIAVRHGTTVTALRRLNPSLDSRGTIRIGQTLQVPTKGPSSFAGRTYPSATVSAADANRAVLASRNLPGREAMRQIIADTARAWGVDPSLALAVAYQESGFNMRVVSPANAIGAMQVIPSSGVWASQMAGRQLDLLDPHDNATAGVVILRSLTRSEPNDLDKAIAGYYQGLAGVRKNGMYPDTRRYVANVRTLMSQFR